MTDMLSAALASLDAGWKPFPCIPIGPKAKAPLTPNGHLDAFGADRRQIVEWWTRYPNAMIGAPVPDAFIVADIDPRNGGSLDTLEALVGTLPRTLTAWSGREDGGQHLYYLRTPGAFTSTRLPAGIDLKVNGYCILPPSIHPATGKPYRWEIHEPAPLPPRLRELLRPAAPHQFYPPTGHDGTYGDALVSWVARQTGNVNDALYWAACRAAETGVLSRIEEDLIRAAAHAASMAGTYTDAGERQSRRTIGSAVTRVAR